MLLIFLSTRTLRLSLSAAAVLFFYVGYGQEQPTMIMFQENQLFYNPAFTGTYGQMVSLNNRTQWAGVTDAPSLQSFTYSNGFKNKAAWGLSVQNDKIFIEKQGVVAIDYNYRLDLSEASKLYLGIKAGGYFKSIDKARLNRLTSVPNSALDAVRNYNNPLLGLGVNFQSAHFYFAAGVPNILNSKRYKESEGILTTATDRPNLYVSSGYNFKVSEQIGIKPAFLYRAVKDAPNLLNLQLAIEYNEKMSVGISKMNNDYMGAMFLFKGMSFLDIGYGYEFSTNSSVTALKENNHELFVRLKLGTGKSTNTSQKKPADSVK